MGYSEEHDYISKQREKMKAKEQEQEESRQQAVHNDSAECACVICVC
ncbi:hypothetical protein HNP86_001972 [Methanococcus maripaludis]|uniref:Uncharacterized protein n=1 Tax=Methanococcus maripaludis TaxID=39152 RepID=A0A7J9NXR4_METMI|nr:hypothetical protein [Methanococcus maripaludis]MBA2851813.1 hypothetical protein [Methanococcus maripaludis]